MKLNVCCLKRYEFDKLFTNLTKKKGKNQLHEIRDESGDITINTNEIQKIMSKYFETYIQIKNLEETEKFLDELDLPKLNKQNINHLNRSIISMRMKQK
jgi:RNA-binding protein YlmH